MYVDSINTELTLGICTTLFLLLFWVGLKTKSKKETTFSSRTKIPGMDFFQYRAYFFEVGLILACALTYLMFEWTVYRLPGDKVELVDYSNDIDELAVVRTAHINPDAEIIKPVQRPRENIVIVEIIGEENMEYINEIIDDDVYVPAPGKAGKMAELQTPPPVPVFKEPDAPLIIAEQMPRFPGCEETEMTDQERKLCSERRLLQFLSSNMKYPVVARENGIKGTVVIQFVVGKDGEIREATLVRDIGGGCGREALRVVELMRQNEINWTPGRQGGRPVSVQLSLPGNFSCNDRSLCELLLSAFKEKNPRPLRMNKKSSFETSWQQALLAPMQKKRPKIFPSRYT